MSRLPHRWVGRDDLVRIRIILWWSSGWRRSRAGGCASRPPAGQTPQAAIRWRDRRTVPADGNDGQPFSSEQLAGKPYACFSASPLPRRLPDHAGAAGEASQAGGQGEDAFAIVLVSVDPARHARRAGALAGLFGTPVIALTGSTPAIEGIKNSSAYSPKRCRNPAATIASTTPPTFLIDADGKFAATISPSEGDPAALASLRPYER